MIKRASLADAMAVGLRNREVSDPAAATLTWTGQSGELRYPLAPGSGYSQIAVSDGLDSPVVPQQSFQRGLQQILAIWPTAGQRDGRLHQAGPRAASSCSTAATRPVSLCPVSGSGFTPSPPSCFLPAKDVERGLEVATESTLQCT